MVFSSMIFLFGFFPAVMALYYLLPKKAKNGWLFLASLFFYAWGEPVYIFIMLFSTVFDYCNGRLIGHFDAKGRHDDLSKLVMIMSVVVNIGILSFFKYTDFAIGTFNDVFHIGIPLLELALPIGISFYTFQTLSYTIDVYLGKVKVQRNIIDFGMYVAMFPQLIAGPIVRYAQVEKEISDRRTTFRDCSEGMQRFIFGLSKKVLLANTAGELFDFISVQRGDDASMALSWLGALMYTFQIYFDFSGYSDMAIGLGKMLGFKFPENFAHPYESKSITEFWRRWHMTLSTWFKEYVYIPLGGNKKGIKRQVLNLFIVWLLTGLWHGAAWNFVIWGLYYFILLVCEKLFLGEILEKLPKPVRHLYALFFIIIGWVIFAFDELPRMVWYLKSMAGAGVAAVSGTFIYELRCSAIMLAVFALFSTALPMRIWNNIEKKIGEKAGFIILSAFSILLLLLDIVFLVNDSYNPFLYFRF